MCFTHLKKTTGNDLETDALEIGVTLNSWETFIPQLLCWARDINPFWPSDCEAVSDLLPIRC